MAGVKGKAGRKPGTPNKKTDELYETAKRCGIDIFETLCLFAKGDWKTLGYKNEGSKVGKQGDAYILVEYTISPELRLHAAKEAAKYLYPQRKALDLGVLNPTDQGSDLHFNVNLNGIVK